MGGKIYENNTSASQLVKQVLDRSHGYYCWRQLIQGHFLTEAFLFTAEQSPVAWLAASISNAATDEWSSKRNHLPTNFLYSSISLAILSTQEIKRHDKEYSTSESLTLLSNILLPCEWERHWSIDNLFWHWTQWHSKSNWGWNAIGSFRTGLCRLWGMTPWTQECKEKETRRGGEIYIFHNLSSPLQWIGFSAMDDCWFGLKYCF